MSRSKIGVFIPCYNAASTIGETLDSVNQAIDFSAREIPVFVYDDCSTDNSIAVAKECWKRKGAFTVVKNETNWGERKTTNQAFAALKNEFDWICIIHADDIVKKDWLSSLIEFIEVQPVENCFTIWSSYDSFNHSGGRLIKGDDSGNVENEKRSKEVIKYFITKVYAAWHISGAAINVSFYNELGGFDERLAQFGDTDFFVRGLLRGLTDIYISRTLTFYRIMDGSVSSVSLKINRDIREVHLLIDKYKEMLTNREISTMYKIIRRLSGRRTIKYLLKFNFTLASANLKEYLGSFSM